MNRKYPINLNRWYLLNFIGIFTVGFAPFYSPKFQIIEADKVFLPFIISADNQQLKEVKVVASKSFIEQKIDRTVVNVDALISNAGTNALEVLEKSPGVTVDENGNITFKGKMGVLVLIDDKPTYLSANDLATYLKSLPSSALEKIELMNNPPAKYEASGNAGVINIKTKKSTTKGFNGSVSATVGYAIYWRTIESLNLNYRVNKFNIFANLGYGIQNSYRRLDLNRQYFNENRQLISAFNQANVMNPSSENSNLKVGFDYYLSPKTTWGILFTGSSSPSTNQALVNSTLLNGIGRLDSTIIADNSTKSEFKRAAINLNFNHQFDSTGKAISFDFDYIKYNSNSDQTFLNNTYTANNILKASQTITDNLPSDINIYSAKIDFTQSLKNKGKIEVGVKSSYVDTDNQANYFTVNNQIRTIDYNLTNHFLYKENINAAYLNINKEFKRFSLQVGFRFENTNNNGHQLDNVTKPDSSFINHYTNLFPTAYLSYKLDTLGKNLLNFTFGRRIGRPYYQDLNPFVALQDKYTYFAGNPFLKPQFSSNYELSYHHQSILTVALSYNYTTDYQSETIQQSGNTFISRTGNIGERKLFMLSVNANLQPTKWWKISIYSELNHHTFQGALYSNLLKVSSTYFYSNSNSQFTLVNGWSAELSLFLFSANQFSQFTRLPSGQVNAGIQKKVMNNKGTIRLNARDIFHTNTPSGDITNIPNATATYSNTFNSQAITLGFTYSFGKLINNKKQRKSDSADSETSRVKN